MAAKLCVAAILENHTARLAAVVPAQLPATAALPLALVAPPIASAFQGEAIPLIAFAALADAHLCFAYLLAHGADIATTDDAGCNLLMHAAMRCSINVITLVLESNLISPSAADETGNIPLHFAAQRNDVRAVALLLEHAPSDLNARNIVEYTPFLCAAEANACRVMDHLISHFAVLDSDEANRLAGHVAVKSGHKEALQLLIQSRKLDLNIRDSHDNSILYTACQSMANSCVALLVSLRGVDVNAPGQKGRSALHVAAQLGNVEAMGYLLSRSDIEVNLQDSSQLTALHLATYYKKLRAVSLLLSRPDIQPNLVDSGGRSAFSISLLVHNFPLIAMFVSDPEVELDVERLSGSDLLYNFATNGDIGAVAGLLERGFHPDTPDPRGRTLLSIAITNGDLELARLALATRKVEIGRRYAIDQRFEDTILHLACISRRAAPCLRILLLYPGIDVNAVDSRGNAALHLAVGTKTKLSVDYLLHDPRVEKNLPNREGVRLSCGWSPFT
jgi:ankyrin repeat protein